MEGAQQDRSAVAQVHTQGGLAQPEHQHEHDAEAWNVQVRERQAKHVPRVHHAFAFTPTRIGAPGKTTPLERFEQVVEARPGEADDLKCAIVLARSKELAPWQLPYGQ